MDPKYFILILFCGHLNNTFFSEIKAMTTEKPQTILLSSPKPYGSANSQNTTGNPLRQPTQFNNISSGQPTTAAKVSAIQPTTFTSSGKSAAPTSAGQPPTYTRQPTSTANTPSQRTAHPMLTTGRRPPTSAHTSMSQPQSSVYASTQPPPSVHTSSRKTIPPTVQNLPIQPTSAIKTPPRITPEFITEDTSNKQTSHKTNPNYIAAAIGGVILLSMLVLIIIIVLCKCLRKPALNDQNWAGRSPFADGETPDICLDNIRENEAFTKRTSIISLMAWKPSKSTLLADDLEIKLFESSENIDYSNHHQTEEIKDQVLINGTSEDSAGGSTIGTAVSSSDDTDLPPPPPQLIDSEGQESNQSDKPTMTFVSPLPNDSTNLPTSPDCPNQVCEDHNSEFKESFPSPSDSLNLPLPPGDFMKNLEDPNNEIQCQEFSILPNADQDLSESLPPPPEELL